MATAEDRIRRDEEAGSPSPAPVLIRLAEITDADEVAAIEARAFSNPWHPETFRSLISQGNAHILIAEDPKFGVVGYAVVWWVLEQGELANLAVVEGFRGRGVGSALLDRVLLDAKANQVESLFLEVRTSNYRAYDLYLSRGFAQVGVRKDYYRQPREDARILVKGL